MLYVIGPAVAGSANLQQNDFVEGMPSPMAALGFGGLLVRRANEAFGLSLDPWASRVLPIYHQISVSPGRLRPSPLRDSTKENGRYKLKPREISETLTGEVIFTLVVEIDAALDEARLAEIVERMRFAGSAIFPYGSKFEIPVRRLQGADISSMRLPRGHAMAPPVGRERGGLISFGDERSLDRFAEEASRKSEKGDGYLLPCAVGLRLLEDPNQAEIRKGTRSADIPHVFCEAGVGFAELISARSAAIARAHPSELATRMWRWSPDPMNRHVMFSDHHLASL